MPYPNKAAEFRLYILRAFWGSDFSTIPPEGQREIFSLYQEDPELVSRVFGPVRDYCPDC